MYKCDKCGFETESHNKYVAHKAHFNHDVVCTECGEMIGAYKRLYDHYITHFDEITARLKLTGLTEIPKCPECGNPLVIRKGKYGKFTACSNYPECKYIKSEPKEVVEVIDCPNCDGKIVERKTKRGKIFYGCNNFPKCKTAYWDKPIGEKCPNCGEMLVEKKDTIKCSSCDYIKE